MISSYDFATHAGRRTFDAALADLLRAPNHAEAEALLAQVLRAFPSPATTLCLDLLPEAVQVEGWAHFNERLATLVRDLPATAVWLDLSNYTDEADDGLRHPVVEIGYVTDGKVAFSQETRDSLLAMSATYPAPWTGGPDEDGTELVVTGLGPLNDWLIRREGDDGTPPAAVAAAQWFELLRYHQAITRNLSDQGLVADIPLIVGAHDVGPWCKAIMYRAKPFAGDLPPAADPRKRARLEAEIAMQIRGWENERARLEMTCGVGTRACLERAREQRDVADRLLAGTPLAGTYPLELDAAGFARFLQDWRRYRDPDGTPPEPPRPAPPPPIGLRRIFGRRGR